MALFPFLHLYTCTHRLFTSLLIFPSTRKDRSLTIYIQSVCCRNDGICQGIQSYCGPLIARMTSAALFTFIYCIDYFTEFRGMKDVVQEKAQRNLDKSSVVKRMLVLPFIADIHQ